MASDAFNETACKIADDLYSDYCSTDSVARALLIESIAAALDEARRDVARECALIALNGNSCEPLTWAQRDTCHCIAREIRAKFGLGAEREG